MMKKWLCITHGNCFDGFGAAWVVRKAAMALSPYTDLSKSGFADIEFHHGIYQTPPPDVDGRHVIMVDFSYKRGVMREHFKNVASLLILDHHKSAIEDLEGIASELPNTTTVFDIERSGAMLAWDYFFKAEEFRRPTLIDYIQDRDLYKFHLPNSREMHAGLASYPMDFATWDEFMDRKTEGETLLRLILDGRAILRKERQDIKSNLKVVKRTMRIGGIVVDVANMPVTMTTAAGELMGLDRPLGFVACYWDTPDGRVFSLRSAPEGIDVSEIAKLYGGGGHVHAAGFTMPRGWEGEDGNPSR